MSVSTVKRFGDFISNLNLTSDVLSVADDGTNTTIVVENVFHARALEAPFERQVLIDNSPYNLISVDYDTNTIVVGGVIASATNYKIENPFYFHGTLISTSNEIKNLHPSSKFPMVYLNEIVTERLLPVTSNNDRVSTLRLAFLDYYSNDWIREDHYKISIRALCNLTEFIRDKLYMNGCLMVEGDIIQEEVPKWGEISISGNTKKWFNDYLDAIEWEFDLIICKC